MSERTKRTRRKKPSTVYTFDMNLGLIKIVKRKRYLVYRLKQVKIGMRSGKIKFEWEKRAYEKWNYKPYEDGDVTTTPEVWLGDVRRFTPEKVHLDPFY